MKTPVVHRRRGIALVITLIMLSVVTITAVAFLAVSRRERGAVNASGEQIDARFATDAALNKVQLEIASRILANGNANAFPFMVSTNYINPRFDSSLPSYADSGVYNLLTNVNYLKNPGQNLGFNLGTLGDRRLYRRMLGNLFYEARPPVFIQTNRDASLPPEFRFYLDLNRNGRYESNGLVRVADFNGRTNGQPVEFKVGDPEWIGVLEYPDAPHSGTNRFVARYAYVVVPSGRTLDLSTAFNGAKNQDNLGSGYLRNQGVGAWELNLAGFLSDLNTNVWPSIASSDYVYSTTAGSQNIGMAFDDAGKFLSYRRTPQNQTTQVAPGTATDLFNLESVGSGAATTTRFQNDRIDYYSDGPVISTYADVINPTRVVTSDNPGRSWSGGDVVNGLSDINDAFSVEPANADKTRGTLPQKLTGQTAATSTRSTYDNYTFYRLLAQAGTDTSDARIESFVDPFGFPQRRVRMHLNYRPQDQNGSSASAASVAGFRDWTPISWFTNAADRLLTSEFTNGLARGTFTGLPIQGRVNVRDNSGRTYFTNYLYTAQVHRLLQLAANIYDYATNRTDRTGYPYLPTVFQPSLYRTGKGTAADPFAIRLGTFTEVTNSSVLLSQPWVDLEDPGFNPSYPVTRLDNAPGSAPAARFVNLPLVVGAKKGFPNFNEGFWQSSLQVTRRLFAVKPSITTAAIATNQLPFQGKNGAGIFTEAQYRFDLRNAASAELWNSYSNNYPRQLRMIVTNIVTYGLYKQFQGGVATRVAGETQRVRGTNILIQPGQWKGYQFTNALNDVATFSFVYDHIANRRYAADQTNLGTVNVDLPAPNLNLVATNWFYCALVDEGTRAIVDYVQFKSVLTETNVLRFLAVDGLSRGAAALPGVRPSAGSTLRLPDFWKTNSVGGLHTLGIDNQMRVSLGFLQTDPLLWRDALGVPQSQYDQAKSIHGLYYFLYHQFPSTPVLPNAEQRRIAAAIDSARPTRVQVGFNPSSTIFITDRRQANDPLVHYHPEDLRPGYTVYADSGSYSELLVSEGRFNSTNSGFQLSGHSITNLAGLPLAEKKRRQGVIAYAPWGFEQQLQLKADPATGKSTGTASLGLATDYSYKDSFISKPDDWSFPTNAQVKFPNIGFLGRVHRGTPWQTVYLKSAVADQGIPSPGAPSIMSAQKNWLAWSGNVFTHPVNDWKLVDLFTTAINDNAARGLISPNQTNIAAWSALLSGVPVLTNTGPASVRDNPQPLFIRPNSTELKQIVGGYTNANGTRIPGIVQWLNSSNSLGTIAKGFPRQPLAPGGYFTNLGSVLSVPTLSDRSPFLDSRTDLVRNSSITDEIMERIPQQILSLMRPDEPRAVVYCFGQSLKPAANSLITAPGVFYGMCTNYQVTGEFATKSVLRFDGVPNTRGNAGLRAVIEDHRALFPTN
jgi:hypothetical protein